MNYRITLEGKAYVVNVERTDAAQQPLPAPEPIPARQVQPEAAAFVEDQSAEPQAEAYITSHMPGNICRIKVSVGQQVPRGSALATLKTAGAVRDVVAPRNGTVKQILVSKGTAVEADDILIVLR